MSVYLYTKLMSFTTLYLFFLNVLVWFMFWVNTNVCFAQGSVEPMQIDADPQEDQQNASESNYIVENPTLVLTGQTFLNAR